MYVIKIQVINVSILKCALKKKNIIIKCNIFNQTSRQWYKANLSMLWPAVRVAATRLRRRLTGRAGR